MVRVELWEFSAAVVFFHSSEYVLAIFFHGRYNVTLSSLLFSNKYVMAMTCALLEYFVELALVPELIDNWLLSTAGLFMVLVGELIRKAGVLTAGQAFTHNIRIYHEDDRDLVSHGIYRLRSLMQKRSEEFFLKQFFGSQYEEYANQVPSGLPFIK